MQLTKTVRLGMLLDIYGGLLTNKMQEILSMYVYDNMSYQEIADNYKISKVAVLDSIKTAEKKLENYESKLQVFALKQNLRDILKNSKNIKQDLTLLLGEN